MRDLSLLLFRVHEGSSGNCGRQEFGSGGTQPSETGPRRRTLNETQFCDSLSDNGAF